MVVSNGKNEGAKGIIIRSNYDNTKERKNPNCLVVGLLKVPHRQKKRNIAKLQERIKKLEASKDSKDKLNSLKSFGVFIKQYNISHLLAISYIVKEDFGITKTLDKLENFEKS